MSMYYGDSSGKAKKVILAGIPGPQGPQGVQGPKGDPGSMYQINATATKTGSTVAITSEDEADVYLFIAPSDFSETDNYTINGEAVTLTNLIGEPVQNAWKQGSPVQIVVQGDKAYFSAGTGGSGAQIPDNLPSLMPNLHVMRLNSTQVEFYFNKVKADENPELQGAVFVYKIDSTTFPQNPTDGTVVLFTRADLTYSGDITPVPQVVRKITVGSSTENLKMRQYTYNAKQQYNTQLAGATASTDDLPEYDPVLANNTPAQIDAIARSGRASEVWNVGDSIDITLDAPVSQTLTFEIVGFDHDPLVEGSGNAGITFGMRHLGNIDVLNNVLIKPINNAIYAISPFATDLNSTVYNCLPAEWKKVIKPVYKKCMAKYDFKPSYGPSALYQGDVQNYQAKLFLFSQKELTGVTFRGIDDGEQYPRFVEVGNYSKRTNNGTGAPWEWWLRTAAEYIASSHTDPRFAIVGTSGIISAEDYDVARATCFGFCV